MIKRGAILLSIACLGTELVHARNVEDNVVYIKTIGVQSGARLAEGSGILLNAEGFVLTALHVARDLPRDEATIFVHMRGRAEGSRVEARIVACSEQRDACLLIVSPEDAGIDDSFEFFLPTCRPLAQQETISAVGWPSGGGNARRKTSGYVAGSLGQNLLYQADLSLAEGMSGGAILDERGRLVGMSLGGDQPDSSSFTFIRALGNLRPLLNETSIDCPISVVASSEQGWAQTEAVTAAFADALLGPVDLRPSNISAMLEPIVEVQNIGLYPIADLPTTRTDVDRQATANALANAGFKNITNCIFPSTANGVLVVGAPGTTPYAMFLAHDGTTTFQFLVTRVGPSERIRVVAIQEARRVWRRIASEPSRNCGFDASWPEQHPFKR